MITLARCRCASVSLVLSLAVSAPAAAAHRAGPGVRDAPAISIQVSGAHANESLKTFLFPSRKPRPAASPASGLPFFVNPLVRRRIAAARAGSASPIASSDAI